MNIQKLKKALLTEEGQIVDKFLSIGLVVVVVLTVAILLGNIIYQTAVEKDEWKKQAKENEFLLKHNSNWEFNSSFLVLCADEKPASRYRGNNDISLLFVFKTERTYVFSFPRDMLVYVPEKGYWLINSLYPYLSGYGATRWFEQNCGLKIDNFIVIDIHKARKLIKKLKKLPLPKEFQKYLADFDYMEDWVRHRSKVGFEINRQRRIQAFLKFSIDTLKKYRFFFDKTLLSTILKTVIETSNSTDLEKDELVYYYRWIMNNAIRWYIWPGQYEIRTFRYPIFKGKKHVWVSGATHYTDVLEYMHETLNPYIYSRTNFFLKKPGVPHNNNIKKGDTGIIYTNWVHIN